MSQHSLVSLPDSGDHKFFCGGRQGNREKKVSIKSGQLHTLPGTRFAGTVQPVYSTPAVQRGPSKHISHLYSDSTDI